MLCIEKDRERFMDFCHDFLLFAASPVAGRSNSGHELQIKFIFSNLFASLWYLVPFRVCSGHFLIKFPLFFAEKNTILRYTLK